jgi:transcriptional regulator with XRE-family HTH domain
MFLLRLTVERKKRKWTQVELGRRAAVRNQDISLIEQGRLIPHEEQLARLAGALNISPPSVLLKPTIFKNDAEVDQLIAEYEEARRAAATLGR